MSDDTIEMRITGWATVCPVCIRLCAIGEKSDKQLLRDGWMHAKALDADEALCDNYSGWNAVITSAIT